LLVWTRRSFGGHFQQVEHLRATFDARARMSAMPARARALSTVAVALLLAGCGAQQAARRDGAASGGAVTVASGSASASANPSATARGAARALHLVPLASFQQPVFVTGAPGDPARVFVVQRTGQIGLLVNGHKRAQPFLDIGGVVNSSGGEQGLLGLAFPTDYARSGRFYVDYTMGNNDIRVAEYRRSARDANRADPASARTVLTIDHRSFTNHNGGQLAFGPEGLLYVGVGDGGSENDPHNYGQNNATLLAKLLRIDPTPAGGYRIPAGNPFAGVAGHRAEIWAYGLRNPWRFSFDRLSGDLTIADVGQDLEEEIDFAPAGSGRGANYGWSVWEGTRRNKPGNAPGAVFPKLVALHSEGYCAIIGGYVVRDRSLPSLYGRYLFGDNCRPQIESVKLSRAGASGLRATGLQVNGTSSFGEDALGHIYVASLDGPVYRLVQR
jgi:glucose/arabinose dehydrogenase